MNAKFEKVTKVIEGKVTITLSPEQLAVLVESVGMSMGASLADPAFVRMEHVGDAYTPDLFDELNEVYGDAEHRGLYDIDKGEDE